MKSFMKAPAMALATIILAAAAPLAASAMSVGVSDDMSTTITSGHLCVTNTTNETHNGTESSWSSASKNGTDYENANTTGSVVDPAATASTGTGNFVISANSGSKSSGTYNIVTSNNSSISGAQQVTTDINHTVSAFANP